MKKVVFSFGLVFAVAGLSELLFRLAGFAPALPLDRTKPGIQTYFWIADPRLGFKNRPNGCYTYDLIRGSPRITTDVYGYRNGYGWSAATTNPIVVFVGDSVVFCAETDDEHTGPSEVARLLGDGISVLNAGVRGYNTLQSRRMLEECLGRFPNIRVAVYCFCGNDLAENLNPDTYFPARAPALNWDEAVGGFVELEVTNSVVPWGSSFEAWVEDQQVSRRLAWRNKRWDRRVRDRLREHSAFFHAVSSLITRLWEGSFPESRPGSAPAEGELGEENRGDVYAAAALKTLLQQMHQLCEKRGARFVVTRFTRKGNDEAIRRWCEEAGVRFVSASTFIPANDRSWLARTRDGGYDAHYGPKGTRAFARALAPAIRELLLSGGESSSK
ncbi:MAG: hypothetical protein ACUVWX_02455 [Kiritimatiellia bacterium]